MYINSFYLTYIAISMLVTIWVARILQRSGRIFLQDAFHGNDGLAEAVNQLLVMGFYLVNLGYIAFALKTNFPPDSVRQLLELESTKLGMVVLILGLMHCFNVVVLCLLRFMNGLTTRRGKQAAGAAA